ncbi:hypothetical protein NMY22_g11692 [Coprinellus aureogranulatus]|nr:hypothetical protein NMY22_g11692 [Coprinellus aureogranulatus]
MERRTGGRASASTSRKRKERSDASEPNDEAMAMPLPSTRLEYGSVEDLGNLGFWIDPLWFSSRFLDRFWPVLDATGYTLTYVASSTGLKGWGAMPRGVKRPSIRYLQETPRRFPGIRVAYAVV